MRGSHPTLCAAMLAWVACCSARAVLYRFGRHHCSPDGAEEEGHLLVGCLVRVRFRKQFRLRFVSATYVTDGQLYLRLKVRLPQE